MPRDTAQHHHGTVHTVGWVTVLVAEPMALGISFWLNKIYFIGNKNDHKETLFFHLMVIFPDYIFICPPGSAFIPCDSLLVCKFQDWQLDNIWAVSEYFN